MIIIDGIILLSEEEIIEINKRQNGGLSDKGKLQFMLSKAESRRLKGDVKRDAASIAAIYWYDIIQNHPFVDGNKRTATEAMKLFLKINRFEIECPKNGFIYLSLKIANGDIVYSQVVEWLYGKINELPKISYPNRSKLRGISRIFCFATGNSNSKLVAASNGVFCPT